MLDPISEAEEELCRSLLDFTCLIAEMSVPDQILDDLHQRTCTLAKVNVLGAFVLPTRWGDLGHVKKGETVFLHKAVPSGWWEEYINASRQHLSPGYAAIHLAMAAFTMTEAMRMLEPLGVDRWGIELHYKYGMRDVLSCPVGGRWVVVYWSSDVLSERLTPRLRALLTMGATSVAIRLQKIAKEQPRNAEKGTLLTPREKAVLRNLSSGNPVAEIAKILGIGEETVRTHLKKAQAKLDVRTQSHAVAEGIRRGYFP